MPADAQAASRFTIRGYQPGDEIAILDLFAKSFPHAPRSLAEWEWKYRADPYGREHISLAFEDDRLVGHYCGYPVPFSAFGRDVIAHQIGDTMTDQSIRHIGRGPTSILSRTAVHFYETFCEGKVAFNYGFNVANIQKFSIRFLRSDRVLSVRYRVRSTPSEPVSRAARWLRGYQLEIVRKVTAEYDDFFSRVAADYGFLIRRDARYLQWRYLDFPGGPYIFVAIRRWRRLIGWIVYRIREDQLSWVDALFDRHHPDAIAVVLRHVAAVHAAKRVEGWFPPHPSWFHDALLDLGFEDRPEPQDLSLMCVPFTMEGATDRMREALYYTMGDGDLI